MIIKTGMWTSQCYNEVQKYCTPVVVADLQEENGITEMIPFDKWTIDPQASLLNFCANETVDGVEFDLMKFPWHLFPEDIPACIDMSSNIGSCDVPWDKVGVVYFGA